MYIDYSKLWKLLIDNGMTKTDLLELTGISSRVLAKLSKNETVTTDTIARICTALRCDVGDMMECVDEENLSVYWYYKKFGKCTEKNEHIKTTRFSVGERKYVVHESVDSAKKSTHIECSEDGCIYRIQLYRAAITPVPVKSILIKPKRTADETVIVLIKGKPGAITGLDENGFVSSRGVPKNPTDIYVMSEAAFKLFSPK
ncbi:MAG: helix-turn-helix transcriptional regulator [Ruminococcaceae bacterium]|nr:helix-turn-helix transcriptional regulator [Oscillospiraceae bacterium]